jgi:hypothetical protein
VLIGIALTIVTLQRNYPALGTTVAPYQGVLICAHLAISFSAVIAALAGPTICLLWQRFAGCIKPQPSPKEVENITSVQLAVKDEREMIEERKLKGR